MYIEGKVEVYLFQDGIDKEVNSIKVLLTTHHKLMLDIRAILKSLAKVFCETRFSTSSTKCFGMLSTNYRNCIITVLWPVSSMSRILLKCNVYYYLYRFLLCIWVHKLHWCPYDPKRSAKGLYKDHPFTSTWDHILCQESV